MRYRTTQAWPVGAYLVPAGSLIDLGAGTDVWSDIVRKHLPPARDFVHQGIVPPRNAEALDNEAREAIAKHWGKG